MDRTSRPCSWPSNSSLPLPIHPQSRILIRKKEPARECGLNRFGLYGLTDFVDLRTAVRACTDCCRLAVLHGDRLRVDHFDLLLVLQAVAFQIVTVLIRDSGSGARTCPF